MEFPPDLLEHRKRLTELLSAFVRALFVLIKALIVMICAFLESRRFWFVERGVA